MQHEWLPALQQPGAPAPAHQRLSDEASRQVEDTSAKCRTQIAATGHAVLRHEHICQVMIQMQITVCDDYESSVPPVQLSPTDACCRDTSKPRMIQHKNEAKTFYRFLSIVYDHIVNPGHWTVDMRNEALEPAKLDDPSLKVRTCMHASLISRLYLSDTSRSQQARPHRAASKYAHRSVAYQRETTCLRAPHTACNAMCCTTYAASPACGTLVLLFAGGGRRRRDGVLHAGRRSKHTAAECHAHRPVAPPAGQSAPQGRPAGRDHPGGASSHFAAWQAADVVHQAELDSLTPVYID